MKEHLYLKDEQIKDLIEQIFYAYRETFSDAKKVLTKHSCGIAHQKAIHLIGRYEGITVSGLLEKLKITKQSLNRVLKDLIKNKTIIMKKSEIDSRHKHIFLNENGKKLSLIADLQGVKLRIGKVKNENQHIKFNQQFVFDSKNKT